MTKLYMHTETGTHTCSQPAGQWRKHGLALKCACFTCSQKVSFLILFRGGYKTCSTTQTRHKQLMKRVKRKIGGKKGQPEITFTDMMH